MIHSQHIGTMTFLALCAAIGPSASFAAESSPAEPKTKPPPVEITAPPGAKPRNTDAYLREFDSAREAYLKKRAEARGKSKELSEQQRREMREQLRMQREEQARAREDLRQQLRQLREQLPSHRDLIDDARERAGSRKRRGD